VLEGEGREVYIHLQYYLDAASWRQRYSTGQVPDRTPYGYHHAEARGYHLTFSKSYREGKAADLLRRACKHFLGFDLWHIWRNRKRTSGVDAIWTHTEQEHLAILLLRRLKIFSSEALLIAQSVWLFDVWEGLPRWKHELYRWLIQSDARTVLTTLSEENLKVARSLFPNKRSEVVRFGISLDSFPLQPPAFVYEPGGRPLRLLSLGSGVQRDWRTLAEAVEGDKDVELLIGTDLSSRTNRPLKRLVADLDRISVELLGSVERIRKAYEWADIVVIPSLPNRHVSGITVMLEAVTAGKPVIATDTGGLKDYFDDDEVYYIPPRDSSALARAIRDCANRTDKTLSRVRKAQAKLLSAELTTRGYALRHVALTEEMLALQGLSPTRRRRARRRWFASGGS
jgi:glycosyltransferase involved in cell wall biosynthesis